METLPTTLAKSKVQVEEEAQNEPLDMAEVLKNKRESKNIKAPEVDLNNMTSTSRFIPKRLKEYSSDAALQQVKQQVLMGEK